MNKKGCEGVIAIIGVLLFITFIVLLLVGLPIEDNTGTQVGYITTVETNGIIFKTVSIYIKSNLISSQEERYCAEEEDIIESLKIAMENNLKVKIYFNDVLFRGIDRCKSEDLDIIYKVEILEEDLSK